MPVLSEATDSVLGVPGGLWTWPAGTGEDLASAAQLETVMNQAESVTLAVRKLVGGRGESELTMSLEPASWSVAQCLDHLTQTTNAFVPAISSSIARAPRLTANRPLRTGALTRLFIRNLEPPYRLRLKVPAALVPHPCDFTSAWGGFQESQARLGKTIVSAAGLAVDQVRVKSPVYARFSYSVYGALRMLTTHQRRHLWQIAQILNALDGAQARHAI